MTPRGRSSTEYSSSRRRRRREAELYSHSDGCFAAYVTVKHVNLRYFQVHWKKKKETTAVGAGSTNRGGDSGRCHRRPDPERNTQQLFDAQPISDLDELE